MIRVLNNQGFPTLGNAAGVAFAMPHSLAREMYRRDLPNREALGAFLDEWGADPEGTRRLVEDEFDAKVFREGLANLGLTLETMRDLADDRQFFEDAYGKPPSSLVLHPSELGVIATALSKEGRIADLPLRPARDEAARVYLEAHLGVTVTVDDALLVGQYRG